MFASLQREVQILVDSVIELTYFMRGAISYDDMMKRTYGERRRIESFVQKRLEFEGNKPFPQY